MADTTDILGLRIPSSDGSDPADLAEIIGNLGQDVDAAVGNPALTTTQINALTGDAKAAGRRVWDTTLGVEKVSNGTTWEQQATKTDVDAKLSKSGGTMTDDLRLTVTTGDRGVSFEKVNVRRFFIGLDTVSNQLRVHSYDAAGVWRGVALAVDVDGHVWSKSHIGGVWSGTVPDSPYRVTITLPASPTGRWAFTCNTAPANHSAVVSTTVPPTSTTVTLTISKLSPSGGLTVPDVGAALTIHWHAIAY